MVDGGLTGPISVSLPAQAGNPVTTEYHLRVHRARIATTVITGSSAYADDDSRNFSEGIA
jgi:hypothetical protein